jgi:diguanylate cyclase (GGDEF)-like protein
MTSDEKLQKGKPRILIVDDLELNRAILCELFCKEYEVLEAENGQEAMEVLEAEHDGIQVVLLDIVMPILDGFGVLDRMSQKGWIGRIPVIMITVETSDGVMQKGYEMGATDIISKPFNPNIIRQRIHNIIEQYTYKQKLERLVDEQTEILRRQSQKLRENSAQMIDTLSAIIEFKNTESVQHIYNIRTLTKILLKEFSRRHREYTLTEEKIESISEAAAMHDIGKIAIPDQILNKPGKLTKEEFEIMKTHTLKGCEILEKLATVQSLAYYDYCYDICRYHHERWDGNGYPDGLKENEIPIWAQAVSIVDVYDALTSKRVYKEAYSFRTAIQMIKDGECGVFNPVMLQCFLKVVSTFEEGIRRETEEKIEESKASEIIVPELENHRESEYELSTRTLRLLELERQKYRILSELSGEILFEYDIKSDKLVFSDQYQVLTGRDSSFETFWRGKGKEQLILKDDIPRLAEKVREITETKPDCRLEMQIDLEGKGYEWYEVYLYPIWDTGLERACIGYMGKLINIQKQKKKNLQLQKAADSDPLTGILNRQAMQKKISFLLRNHQIQSGALGFIDLDNFKFVNDNFGHMFGDEVLKRVASVLKSTLRETDFIGRIGGDEFIVFFRDISSSEALDRKLEQMCDNLRQNIDGCTVSVSIGASRYPQDGDTYDELLHKADQALYMSKRMGKNGYQIYDEACGNKPFRSLLSGMDEYDEHMERIAQALK